MDESKRLLLKETVGAARTASCAAAKAYATCTADSADARVRIFNTSGPRQAGQYDPIAESVSPSRRISAGSA